MWQSSKSLDSSLWVSEIIKDMMTFLELLLQKRYQSVHSNIYRLYYHIDAQGFYKLDSSTKCHSTMKKRGSKFNEIWMLWNQVRSNILLRFSKQWTDCLRFCQIKLKIKNCKVSYCYFLFITLFCYFIYQFCSFL